MKRKGKKNTNVQEPDQFNEQVKEIEWKLEKREREDRKNNIIIKGLKTNTEKDQLKKEVEEFLEKKLQIKAEMI